MHGPRIPRINETDPISEPLPMKQRALPQSFWQQPNVSNPQPPGVVCSNLPPLPIDEEASIVAPSAGSSAAWTEAGQQQQQQQQQQQRKQPHQQASASERSVISAANTDLLFSLFNSVEEEEAQRRIHVVRRGR